MSWWKRLFRRNRPLKASSLLGPIPVNEQFLREATEDTLAHLGLLPPLEAKWEPKTILRALLLVVEHPEGFVALRSENPKQQYGLAWEDLQTCVMMGLFSVVPVADNLRFIPSWSAVGVARAAHGAGLLSDASAGVYRA